MLLYRPRLPGSEPGKPAEVGDGEEGCDQGGFQNDEQNHWVRLL